MKKAIFLLLLICLVINRSLIFNLGHSFYDWGDTAFISWQTFMTREKIVTGQWSSINTTNSHYPFKNSLFFTDTFIGQSLMGIPLFFIKNPVLLQNLIFLSTIFLNYLVVFFLFRKIFKTNTAGFLASLFFNNSVYFFDQIIHPQMLCYWPMMVVLYYLIDLVEGKNNYLKALSIGLFISIQFYMSVYLGIFTIFMVGVYFCLLFFYKILFSQRKLKSVFLLIKQVSISLIIFFILTYPFLIKNYFEFEKTYHVTRDINEILMNSGHLTDYLFPISGTVLSSLGPIKSFINFNRHTAPEKIYFPGMVLCFGGLLGVMIGRIKWQKKQKELSITNGWGVNDIFFVLLGVCGLVFSLGPRLNANGKYLEIPLPYLLFLNKLDLLHSIRVTHRWEILLILALVYFAVKTYNAWKNKLLILGIVLFFLLESIPLKLIATQKNYIDNGYTYLKNHAKKDEVLMELPFLNLEKNASMDYATRMLLSSTYHQLNLFNGYTGIFINDYGILRIYLERFFPNQEYDEIIRRIGVSYLRINKPYFEREKLDQIKLFYQNQIVYEDNNCYLIKLQPLPSGDINKIRVKLPPSDVAAQGSDKKFFLNLLYFNPGKELIINRNQQKVRIQIAFMNGKEKVYIKNLDDLITLVNYPLSERARQITFFVKKKFDRVIINIRNYQNKLIINKEISL